ncbi:MAG: hypothetical protein M3069_30700 [Chloroflexota bacterium]|nr:hypothetical protein [Chloroflexota bacterium]
MADLRSEAEIKSHPLSSSERCQLASQPPVVAAIPVPVASVQTPESVPASVVLVTPPQSAPTPAPPTEQAITEVQPIAAAPAATPDLGMPAESVQTADLPVEVAGAVAEVPVALPDAGDGSMAEITLDDVEP